jgi:7-cyano-7-deazaguanine synthase
MKKPKAIVLLSGGLDSVTCLAIACHEGFNCYALTLDYGQKHESELKAAQFFASLYGAKHRTLHFNLTGLAQSALIDEASPVPDYKGDEAIPPTYVPARNTLFLSIALGWAETVGAQHIFVGANAVDYSGYPDCRPAFIEAFEQLANVATKAGVEGKKFHIRAPLLSLTKAEIILQGLSLGIDYRQTVSCYRADEQGRACSLCDSCQLRKKGFQEAGVLDPTHYVICRHS